MMQNYLTMGLCAVALLWGCGGDSGGTDAGTVMLMDGGGGGGIDAGGGGGIDAGGGGGIDAGGGGGIDAGGGGTDAGGGGPRDAGDSTGTVDCMGTACDADTEICCIMGGLGGGATGMCIPNTEMCMGGAAACDGPEDCEGAEVCCAMISGLSGAAACTTEACGGGFTSFELCHDASDCTDTTQMCCPIMMFGFSGAYCAAMCGFGP